MLSLLIQRFGLISAGTKGDKNLKKHDYSPIKFPRVHAREIEIIKGSVFSGLIT